MTKATAKTAVRIPYLRVHRFEFSFSLAPFHERRVYSKLIESFANDQDGLLNLRVRNRQARVLH